MKRLLILFLLVAAMSCKKTNDNSDPNASQTPVINYERTGDTNNSFVDPGPKWKWAFGDDRDPGPNYECWPTSNICFMIGPIYYRNSQVPTDDEAIVSLSNENGKLKAVFDLESMTSKTINTYFSTGYFDMNTSKQFPDDLAKELNLKVPYFISKNKYKIVELTSSTMSILF